jgi:putative ABC transport system permease protein
MSGFKSFPFNFFRFKSIRRKRKPGDFDAEIEAHLRLEKDRLREQGLSDEDAGDTARRAFGNVTHAQERFYESGRQLWWDHFWQDIRYASRVLRKNPGFSIVAVLTLALGIGANTAIFSVIESVLFRPLPFSNPDQIVRVYSTYNGKRVGDAGGPSPMDLRDFVRSNHSFEKMTVSDTWRKNVSFAGGEAQPEQMRVGLVPGAYFEILDIKPILGRVFTEDESWVGKNYVAAISARVWRNRFAGDSAILGRKIYINDEPYTIVAVMPNVIPEWMDQQGFNGDHSALQIWTPFGFADSLGDLWTEAGRRGRGWYALGRIKPGVSIEQAQADLATLAAGLAAAHPADRGIGVTLEKLSDSRASNLRPMLLLLMGAVTLILLIACVNMANLLLARNSARERELAMRAALGAERGRLVRQLLAETLLLSLIGGAFGLLLAQFGVTSLSKMRPELLPQLASLGVNWRVLLFTVAASLATSLIFGLGPAVAGARLNLVETLKLGTRSGTAGSGAQRMRNVLVMTEMAMSLMLLVGAGLLIQSIVRLEHQQLGIRQDHLLKGHFYLPGVRYPNPGAITRFCDQFAEKLRATPGIVEASVTTVFPPVNGWRQMLDIPGHPASRIQDIPFAEFGLTDAHFLKTFGIPLIRGRDFGESDNATTPLVALISQELERKYFSTEDPIGRRIHIGPPQFLQIPPGANTTDSADVTIVGVIGNFRNNGLAAPPEPQIIVLYSQHPLVNYGFKDVVIRAASDPHVLIPEITRELHALDSDMPFAQAKTIDELVEQETGSQRFTTMLLALFAAAGLTLAAVGIYGVVSFLVAQRKRELAIRVAIGASVTDVLWLVLKQGLQMALLGASIGLVGVWAAQKLLNGLLFGISAVDPVTFAGAAAFLLTVVMIACWIPAWRASRVDPCIALRAE